jgi:hypothetical protein
VQLFHLSAGNCRYFLLEDPFFAMESSNDPEALAHLLLLQKLASAFPDYPKDFVPPALLDPNYVAPNNGAKVTIVCSVSMAVALVVVIARLMARRLKSRESFGADDWAIIPATVRIPEQTLMIHVERITNFLGIDIRL